MAAAAWTERDDPLFLWGLKVSHSLSPPLWNDSLYTLLLHAKTRDVSIPDTKSFFFAQFDLLIL